MDVGDTLSVFMALKGNVWTVWTFVVTVNLAMLGWLIQRHGLYGVWEKSTISIIYSVFILIGISALYYIHMRLDQTLNDMYHVYSKKPSNFSTMGMFFDYVEDSAEYCRCENIKASLCSGYLNRFYWHSIGVLIGWFILMFLFISNSVWNVARANKS